MNPSPDDLRRYYDSLSDQALLEIKREDLTEIAQQICDMEMRNRRIARPAAKTVEDTAVPEIDPGAELVVAAEFDNISEARLAQASLHGAEIPSSVSDDHLGGFRLMVQASMEEQALEVLATPLSDEELAAQAEAAGNPDEDE